MSTWNSTWDEAEAMCVNCVTPWKCNGPHLRLDAATVEYIRQRVAADRTLAWPAEIDDILDDAAAFAEART